MKVRSRYQGRVEVVDVEYTAGQPLRRFFNQVVGARSDLEDRAGRRFLVRMPADNKLLKIEAAEQLQLAIDTRKENKPLVVIIRDGKQQNNGKQGVAGKKGGQGGRTGVKDQSLDARAIPVPQVLGSSGLKVRSRYQGAVKLQDIPYDPASGFDSFVRVLSDVRGDIQGANTKLKIFVRDPLTKQLRQIDDADKLRAAVASKETGKPFFVVIRPIKSTGGGDACQPSKKMKVMSRYQGKVKNIEVNYKANASHLAFFKQLVRARDDIKSDVERYHFLFERPEDKKLERVESQEALEAAIAARGGNQHLIVAIRPKRDGGNRKSSEDVSPQLKLCTRYQGISKVVAVDYSERTSFESFFKQILQERGDVQHGIRKNNMFAKREGKVQHIDSTEKLASIFSERRDEPPVVLIIRPRDAKTSETLGVSPEDDDIKGIALAVRSRFNGQKKVVHVDFVPQAPPRALFKQVVKAREDMGDGLRNKTFLVKNSADKDSAPRRITSSTELASIVSSCNNGDLVIVIRQSDTSKENEVASVTKPVLIQLKHENQPDVSIDNVLVRMYGSGPKLMKLDSDKSFARAIENKPSNKPMRLVAHVSQ